MIIIFLLLFFVVVFFCVLSFEKFLMHAISFQLSEAELSMHLLP